MSVPSALLPTASASPLRMGFVDRVGSGLVACGCLAVLVIAAMVSPSPEGHGTHEQIGLASCGWAQNLNRPCPTCGMTTSFAWMLEGRPIEALRTQPFGAALALVAATVFWICLHSAATGSRSAAVLASRALRPAILWPVGVAFFAAWGYKVWAWGG